MTIDRYDYIEELQTMLSRMGSDYDVVSKTANRAFGSSLMIAENHGKMDCFAVTSRGGKRRRKTISSDMERVYRLANKAYSDELASRLMHNRRLLDEMFRKMMPTDYGSILTALPRHFDILDASRVMHPSLGRDSGFPNPSKDVLPKEAVLSIGSMDPWEWAAMPYCENTDHPEFKIHPTRYRVFCRSKSEAILFELYRSLAIPFHFDETITIDGRLLSPDFNGARRDGMLIYHEHKGVHSTEYRERDERKSELYAAAGIFPGVNLICTYDNDQGTLNVKLAEELLRDAYWL